MQGSPPWGDLPTSQQSAWLAVAAAAAAAAGEAGAPPEPTAAAGSQDGNWGAPTQPQSPLPDPGQQAALQNLLSRGAAGGGIVDPAAPLGRPHVGAFLGWSPPAAAQLQQQSPVSPLGQAQAPLLPQQGLPQQGHLPHAAPPQQAQQWAGQAATAPGWQGLGAAEAAGTPMEEEEVKEEEEEEEGGGGGRQASRRERNRLAAARYRQRQKETKDQEAAALAAGAAQLEQLLANRRALCTEQRALLATEAVQKELHAQILVLCSADGPASWAALHAASLLPDAVPPGSSASSGSSIPGSSSGSSSGSSGGSRHPGATSARLVEATERRYVRELATVVQAGSPQESAKVVLRMLPAGLHPALDGTADDFLHHCCQLQSEVQGLVAAAQHEWEVGPPPHTASEAQRGPSGGGHHQPSAVLALEKCATLRKLFLALALAKPAPEKVMLVMATSSGAPVGTWKRAASLLSPTLTERQLEVLSGARKTWVARMGPLLAARGHSLSRLSLESWQAALAAMQGPGSPEERVQWAAAAEAAGALLQVAAAAVSGAAVSPTSSALQQSGGSSPRENLEAAADSVADAAEHYPGMHGGARSQGHLKAHLRLLADSYQRAWVCLISFLLTLLQSLTLWQCSLMLATCGSHFPDLVCITGHLLDIEEQVEASRGAEGGKEAKEAEAVVAVQDEEVAADVAEEMEEDGQQGGDGGGTGQQQQQHQQ